MLSSKEKGHKDKLLQNIPSRYVKNCSSGHVIIYDLRFWALHVIDVSMVQVFFAFPQYFFERREKNTYEKNENPVESNAFRECERAEEVWMPSESPTIAKMPIG